MRPLIEEIATAHSPESLVERLQGEAGVVLLGSALFDAAQARYSFVAARPFLTLRAFGSRCELLRERASGIEGAPLVQFGNPWRVLDGLMARYELLDELDLPFPLGGCFGYWGYDLKNFVEPKLPRRSVNDLELPDCHVGFYGSLVVFDHQLGKTWIVATGLDADGSRSERNAHAQRSFWRECLASAPTERGSATRSKPERKFGVVKPWRVAQAGLLRVIDPRSVVANADGPNAYAGDGRTPRTLQVQNFR